LKTFADFNIDIRGKTGRGVKTFCPECRDSRQKKNRSDTPLSVNVDEGVWNCHNCGWTGCLGGDGRSRDPGNGNGDAGPSHKSPYTRPKYEYPMPIPDKVLSFLVQQRGISPDVLDRNKVGWVNSAITFPFIKSGQVVNIKFRGPEKKFWQSENAEKCFYGYDDIDNGLTIITEGELDKLALETCGFRNSVSCPDGAPQAKVKQYSTKFSFISDAKTRLDEVKRFVLALDNDETGKVLQGELVRRLGFARCLFVTWPEGCKDANEALLKHGKAIVRGCINSAERFSVDGISIPMVVFGKDIGIQDHYKHGLKPGLKTGWESFDKIFSFSQDSGELNIVTGYSGHGKSEFIDALLVNLVKSQGWRIGVFSPENHPLKIHGQKIIEKYTGKPFGDRFRTRMSEEEMLEGERWLHDHFYFIKTDDEKPTTADDLLITAWELVHHVGIKAIVFDPWNEFESGQPSNLNETRYISVMLGDMRRFAQRSRCHVFLVAHPKKPTKDKDTGAYPVPTPWDISGSAHWKNKADNCITVYRDTTPELQESDDPEKYAVQILIQKVRNKHIGKLGSATLYYKYSTGEYFNQPLAANGFNDYGRNNE